MTFPKIELNSTTHFSPHQNPSSYKNKMSSSANVNAARNNVNHNTNNKPRNKTQIMKNVHYNNNNNVKNTVPIESNININQLTTQSILQRMPKFELSYETVAHKKVFSDYDLCMSIPTGKKFLAWFSFYNEKDVCYLMELNKEKQVSKIYLSTTLFDTALSINTLIYGTLLDAEEPVNLALTPVTGASCTSGNINKQDDDTVAAQNANALWATTGKRIFMLEDMYYYKGIPLTQVPFGDKLGYIEEMFTNYLVTKFSCENSMIFSLPWMWAANDASFQDVNEMTVLGQYEEIKKNIGYNVHHIQVRKFNTICPYYNIPINNVLSKMNKKEKPNSSSQLVLRPKMNMYIARYAMDSNKSQYKYPAIFKVRADVQYDVYHLFAYGKNKEEVYYSVAYIPNLRVSVFMNRLFRRIRENENLDLVEESDDEDDFENMAFDKYVDLNKIVNIECIFHTKFKKWVPMRVVDSNTKIVHIGTLVKNYIY